MLLLVAVLIAALNLIEGTEYFVSLNGNDNNSGTVSQPFQHVQRALELLKPGDVCTIRGGRYYEEVSITGLQGLPGNPITFRAYPGENVVFDGTIPLVCKWSKLNENIYTTKVTRDVWQLFVDGEMQVNARWPNAFWNDFSVFDYTHWGFSSSKSTYDQTTGTGLMDDNGTQNLAGSGLNATGAIAILNIGSWLTWAGYVEEHKPGDSSFTYNLSIVPTEVVHFKPLRSRYFLEDKLEFLDAPTEWYYDKGTGLMYLWTQSGDSPENHEIRGKVSTYAITVTDSSSWLVFSQIGFFGTTVFINGGAAAKDVHNIVLDSLHFSYPSYTKRMLGSIVPPNTTTIVYNGILTKDAGNFTIFNCSWEYADGQTIEYRGADGMIQNNLWHHNDFTCVGDGYLFLSRGVRDNFIQNVIHSNGPSVGYAPGGVKNAPVSIASHIKLNLLYDLKFLQNDGSLLQIMQNSQENVVLEQNWGFNTLKRGMRFDCGDDCDGGNWGHNGTMRYNVMWNTSGLSLKGNNHSVINNLVFNTTVNYADMFIEGFPGIGTKGENNNTVTAGNIFEHGACSYRSTDKCNDPIPGIFTNNIIDDDLHNLRDPNNLDFRPKPNSVLIAKGIGPYGQESMSHGGYYWIPGRLSLQASSPIPPNATTTAKCDADLMWLTGYQAEKHNVYFGTNKTAVMTVTGSSSDAFIGQLNVPSNIATPGPLKPGAMYFWRVDAVSSGSINIGSIWCFVCI